ncbi:MAG: hypothetical protein MR606_05970 [Mollicutes bacterium]|nr:hypothetical protein [Mollicutes bacterium]
MAKKRYKRPLPTINKKQEIFKQVQNEVREANKRLNKLERGYDINRAKRNPKTGRFERPANTSMRKSYKSGTWSSKKLKKRLTTETTKAWKEGRIKINENMTITQLRAVQKATRQFMKSVTSTVSGIERVKKETISSLKGTLSIDEEEITEEEAETLYDMLSDEDFSTLVNKIGASTAWALIEDAKEANDTENQFITRLSRYAFKINDETMKNKALKIYEKYVI